MGWPLFLLVLMVLVSTSLSLAPGAPASASSSSPHVITLGASVSSDHFVVQSRSEDAGREVLAYAEHAWEKLAPRFSVMPRRPIQIVVVEDETEYDRIQPAPMTRGFATFGGNTMYLRGPQTDGEVVAHELTHLILGQMVRPNLHIPDWFNEGLAQYAAGSAEPTLELIYRMNAGEMLSLPALSEIDALQSADREMATLQGLAVVRFFVHEFGEDRLWQLVDDLRYARTFNQALMEAYGYTDLELNEKWLAYAETNYSLMSPALLRTVGLLATGLLAVLALLVWFTRRARRDRASGEPGLTPQELAAAGWASDQRGQGVTECDAGADPNDLPGASGPGR